MRKVLSPLTKEDSVTLVKTFDAGALAQEYKKSFGIDIAPYLRGAGKIDLFKCEKTGLRFFHPFDLHGDSGFYEKLETFPWYYMETKWEHDETLKTIGAGSKVLEIGAARGAFLQRAMKIPDVTCVGLELNESAASQARTRGVNVLVQPCEEHSVHRKGYYDVVCSFQVLEHVSDPTSILDSAIQMLKPGGKLILGVPDNSMRATPSIFVSEDNPLNMPPHHLSQWDVVSLSSLPKIFPIELETILVEPAGDDIQKMAYRKLVKDHWTRKYGFLGWVYYLATRRVVSGTISLLSPYLPSHTILATYRKRE